MMELVFSSGNMNMIPICTYTYTYTFRINTGRFSAAYPFRSRRFGVNFRSNPFLISSKKSSFPDFQEYAKPTRLLPARDLKSFGDESPDKISALLQSDGSQSLYKVLLCTSSIYGSDLSDLNAGVLICIIDESGNSVLKRIPAIDFQGHMQQSEDSASYDHGHFQRGSVDKFMFWAPRLRRIQAMWIGPESGNWRLKDAGLTITSISDNQAGESNSDEYFYHSVTCNFNVEEVLLGEGSDMAMLELRPYQIIEYSGIDPSSTLDNDDIQAASLAEMRKSNEESMREYSDLKYSLLLYDSILIFAGTSILSVTGGESNAVAFLTGGISGFLYLLLLQKSVDRLPSPDSVIVANRNSFNSLFGGAKGPLLVLALAFGISGLALKHGTQDVEVVLTPREIVVAMLGFLACKLSVVLAAVKPMSIGLDDKK